MKARFGPSLSGRVFTEGVAKLPDSVFLEDVCAPEPSERFVSTQSRSKIALSFTGIVL